MGNNKFFKKFISTILGVTFIGTQSLCIVGAFSLSGLKNKQSSIEREQVKLNKRLNNIKNGINSKEHLRVALENNIKNIAEKIDKETKKLDEVKTTIEEKQTSINDLQSHIDDKYNQLKRRVCAIYKSGDTSLIEILMGSESFNDLLDKADLIQKLSKYDSDIIASLNLDIQKVASEKAIIEQNKIQIETIKGSLSQNKSKLEKAEIENEKNIKNLKNSQNRTESRLNQIALEKQRLEEQISKFHENYTKNAGANHYKKGRYVWPTPECHTITSPFGRRWGSFHHGIDISGRNAYGSPIVSAGDGVVIKVNSTNRWGSGWGYHVMIDHGNGYATLYAHCSSVNVSQGQHVKAGQLIARIGNTGHSFGNHLHFETWHNGKRYNPSTEV